ncbi:MAG: lysylphosphatidylglycerol synthase transmembrane domain-containing protein [Pseudomonadota bacterium]|nr:lysylphosphatidylglycerol synthase transmembrane domain-containing protein [Pseudomonadota bacterium]
MTVALAASLDDNGGDLCPAKRRPLLLRALATAMLLGVLLLALDTGAMSERLASIKRESLLLVVVILAAQYLLACARWHFILRQLHVPLDARQAVSIYGIGALANMLLLVSIAGLSARGVLLVRSGSDVSRAGAALAAERLAALTGLFICFVLALVPGYALMQPHLGAIDASRFALAVLTLSAVGSLAAWALWRFNAIRRFFKDLKSAFASWRTTLLLVLASTLIIYLGFAGIAALARGMNIAVEPVFFISVMPIVVCVTSLPISIGGWGVREGMMVAGLSLFHVPAESAFALSVSFGLIGVAVVLLLAGASAMLASPTASGDADRGPDSRQARCGAPN